MRCGRCGHVWQATPIDTTVEILPPETGSAAKLPGPFVASAEAAQPYSGAGRARMVSADAVPERADAVEEAAGDRAPADDTARAHAAARRVAPPLPRVGANRAAHGFVIGLAVALVVAAVQYRAEVVRAVPTAAGLYRVAGMPVNLRGLAFQNIVPRRVSEDGLPILLIEGEVVNLRDERVSVPAIRVAVRGPNREELYAWTVEPANSSVDAGETMRFRTRLAAPPSASEDVKLRFVERTRQSPGIRP